MPRQSPQSALLQAAQDIVSRLHEMNVELVALREENAQLRAEVEQSAAVLRDSAAELNGKTVVAVTPRRARRTPKPAESGTNGARRRRRGSPESITPNVVMAAIGKLGGGATARQIAEQISSAGAVVNGRAIRFLAEKAGAAISVSEDGQRLYSLPA